MGKYDDIPGVLAHGEAWRTFFASKAVPRDLETPNGRSLLVYGWQCFLAGWLGKAKQHDLLRGRR